MTLTPPVRGENTDYRRRQPIHRLFPSASAHFRIDGARPERPPGGGGSGRGDPITQMFYGDSALGRLIREALMMLVDALVKSPLEADFSGTRDWDIVVPQEHHAIELSPDAMAECLAKLCAEVAGFSGEHAEKIGERMRELPVGMFANYRYQIADGGSTAELQIRMTKRPGKLIAMELRSSEAVIGAVRMAFRGARGDEEEDPDA